MQAIIINNFLFATINPSFARICDSLVNKGLFLCVRKSSKPLVIKFLRFGTDYEVRVELFHLYSLQLLLLMIFKKENKLSNKNKINKNIFLCKKPLDSLQAAFFIYKLQFLIKFVKNKLDNTSFYFLNKIISLYQIGKNQIVNECTRIKRTRNISP